MTALRSFQSFKMFQSFQMLKTRTDEKERVNLLSDLCGLCGGSSFKATGTFRTVERRSGFVCVVTRKHEYADNLQDS